jgi:arylsulfatase A-like enzyme/tetratricopeptide (TPR) repeat protein
MRRPLAALLALTLAIVLGAACWWLRGGRAAAQEGGSRGDIADRRPKEAVDVILVTIDTLRADALGVSGNPEASTPLLDRLANAGRLYVNAHAHNVVTLPSHVNILTGRYPYQHGVRDNSGFTVPAGIPTLATLLKQAGYATGAFVGAYPLDARFGLNRGFDVYDDHYPRGSNPSEFVIAERRGDQVVAPALAWWRSQAAEPGKKNRPRFLWVHLYDPHASYDPPEPFKSRFAAKPYLGEVAASDSFLAPLLEPVLDGKEKPALVIVTGDHGEALGDHGELTHGLFAYESTLHVPLIVWGAGVHPGRDERWARHVDIVPTVLERLGVAPPQGLPGRSLLEPPPRGPEDSYFEALSTNLNRGWAPLRGVLRDGRKWIDLPIPELYNLPVDPKEEKNLAGISGGDRRTGAALRKALPEEAVWPPRKGSTSPEEEQRLRSLGYSVGTVAAKSVYTPADDPKSLIGVDRKLHTVVDLYSRGHYPEAAALAREVIAERPELAEAYEHAALSLQMLERHDEAVAVLRSGLGKVVADESLRRHLAQALSESGRPTEAVEAVEVLRPYERSGEPATLAALGVALSDAGRNDEGERVLRGLLAQDASDPKAHENLGIVLLRMSRPAEARAELRRALDLNASLPIAWNTLGVALYQLEGPEAALTAWRKAYELDPKQYEALFNTGLVAASLGRRDEARDALAQFARTAPPQRFGADIRKAEAILREIGG